MIAIELNKVFWIIRGIEYSTIFKSNLVMTLN